MRRIFRFVSILSLLCLAPGAPAASESGAAGDEATARRRAEAYYTMVRNAPRPEEFLQLLHQGDFAALEKKLEELQRGYETGKVHEFWVSTAFESFAEPRIESDVQRWAEQRPGAWQARAARGAMYWGAAQRARGGKAISETLPQQIEEMEKDLGLSVRDLRAVLATRPKFLPAYAHLIDAARMLGDDAMGASVVRAALLQDPRTLLVRESYMLELTPAWGGSFEAMDAFAREAQAYAGENPELISLIGETYVWRASESQRNHDNDRTIALYTEALRYGHWTNWLIGRGRAYADSQHYQEALADFDGALRNAPYSAELFARRAACLHDMGNYQAAAQDYGRAAELAPNASWIMHHYAKELEFVGPVERAALYEHFLAAHPDAVDMLEGLGEVCLTQLHQLERARDVFAREVELAPERLSGWRDYATVLHQLHDPRARSVYDHYFELVDRSTDSGPMAHAEHLLAQSIRRNLEIEARSEGNPH